MTPIIFIGVDVSPGRPPFTLAALDCDRKLVALSQGPLAEMLAFASGQSEIILAISAPARPNQGLVTHQDTLPDVEVLRPTRQANLRMAEQELIKRNMVLPRTHSVAADCPVWMQRGFTFYEKIQAAGYAAYPAEQSPRRWLETQAKSCYHNLLNLAPFPAGTLEGRIQCQLILSNEGLPVRDAMDFFEEVTRHKLLHGILPAQDIHPQNELNALMAAHVAWLAAIHPERLESFGDPTEGCIYLPTPPPTKGNLGPF